MPSACRYQPECAKRGVSRQMQTGSPFKATKLAPRFTGRAVRHAPRIVSPLATPCATGLLFTFRALCLRASAREDARDGGPPPRPPRSLQRRAPRRAARQRLAQLVEMLAHLLSSLSIVAAGRASPPNAPSSAAKFSTPPVEAGSRSSPPGLASARTVGLAAARGWRRPPTATSVMITPARRSGSRSASRTSRTRARLPSGAAAPPGKVSRCTRRPSPDWPPPPPGRSSPPADPTPAAGSPQLRRERVARPACGSENTSSTRRPRSSLSESSRPRPGQQEVRRRGPSR